MDIIATISLYWAMGNLKKHREKNKELYVKY